MPQAQDLARTFLIPWAFCKTNLDPRDPRASLASMQRSPVSWRPYLQEEQGISLCSNIRANTEELARLQEEGLLHPNNFRSIR